MDPLTTSVQQPNEEEEGEVIETTGTPEKLITSTKPYYFPDLLLSIVPHDAEAEKSQTAAKSVEMDPNPNFLSVSSVTISPILRRKKVRPLFDDAITPLPTAFSRSRASTRGHRDHLFSVDLLKEEDARMRPHLVPDPEIRPRGAVRL